MIVAAVYGTAIKNDFVLEDKPFITLNTYIQDMKNIPSFFLEGDTVGMQAQNPYYRPLTTASFALDYQLWGANETGFHLTNILLHLATCMLLFLLAGRFLSIRAAFLCSVLFAVHPANSEPVAYIVARADLLCGALLLASTLLFFDFLKDGSRFRAGASVVFFAGALFSKIVAVMLPALLLLHLWRKNIHGKHWKIMGVYFLTLAAFLHLRSLSVSGSLENDVSFHDRLATSATIVFSYLKMTISPIALTVVYDLPVRTRFADAAVLGSISMIGVLMVCLAYAVSKAPMVGFGLSWYLAALLPVSGLVILFKPSILADRYLYIPLLGAMLVAGYGLEWLGTTALAGRFKTPLSLAGVVLVVSMSMYTASRVAMWENDYTWATGAIRAAPQNTVIRLFYSNACLSEGRINEAESVVSDVAAGGYDGDDLHALWSGIAWRKRDYAVAERHALNAINRMPGNPLYWTNLATIELAKGQKYMGTMAIQQALQLNPRDKVAQEMQKALLH